VRVGFFVSIFFELSLTLGFNGTLLVPMKTTITVYERSVYGSPKIYAADPNQARALSTLTNGAKTLEHRHLCALEALGFAIVGVSDPKSIVRAFPIHA